MLAFATAAGESALRKTIKAPFDMPENVLSFIFSVKIQHFRLA